MRAVRGAPGIPGRAAVRVIATKPGALRKGKSTRPLPGCPGSWATCRTAPSNSSRSAPDPAYKVPILKFVIDDLAPDDSLIPTAMRPLPPLPRRAP